MAKDLEEMKEDTSKDYDLTQQQRESANEDLRFCTVEGGMWEGYLEDTHDENSGRTRMELDIVSDYVERFVGEWTQNRTNVTYTPSDDATTDEDSEMLNGMYRADFKDYNGQNAQDNAVREVAYTGSGAFMLKARYDEEDNVENPKQHIAWKTIWNAHNHVLWDSNAKESDKSDARRCTLLWAYTEDAFEEEYPNKAAVSAYTPSNRSFLNRHWRSNKMIYVAERYEIEKKRERIHVYENFETGKIERIKESEIKLVEEDLEAMGFKYKRSRTVLTQNCYRTVFSGEEILEKRKRIVGKYIPVIAMYGYRTYVDDREYSRGLVRKLKDAQRLFNSNISKMAETAAFAPTDKPVFTRAQIEGISHLWQDMTNKAYAVVNDLYDADGNLIPSGPIATLTAPQVDPNTIASTEIVGNFVQMRTGNAPQDQIDPDASGKAINALRKRENLNTQTISDNIRNSIKRSGEVYRAMAAEVYNSKRVKRLVAEDGTESTIQLFKTTLDTDTGMLIEINKPGQGRFKVDVEVGPQYESQKEATIESIERLIERLPENSPYFMPLLSMWIENIVGTGLDPIKDFNRKEMLTMGLVEPATDEEKQFLAEQQAQAQEDPNAELVQAAARNEESKARKQETAAALDLAKVEETQANTAKIINEIGMGRVQQLLDMAAGRAQATSEVGRPIPQQQSAPSNATLQ